MNNEECKSSTTGSERLLAVLENEIAPLLRHICEQQEEMLNKVTDLTGEK